jgi:uncharacterized membrane protein
MIVPILIVALLTFIPLLELRFSIPVGILSGSVDIPFGITLSGLGMNPAIVFIIAVLTNIFLGFLLFYIWESFDHKLRESRIKKPYTRFMNKAHRKLKKFVDRYGVLGVALFIGIPLPGSGVYTGSLGAFVLGLDRKQYYKACVLGVLIAGILVTIITLGGISIFT